MAKTRKNEISLINIALCFCVIFIHAASSILGKLDLASWQYAVVMSVWKLSSCAVPGFFFLSALKLSLGADKSDFSYIRYILSRIKRVWLPYAAAVIVYFLYFVHYGYMTFDIPEAVKLLFDGNMSAHFYFVVAVMQFYLLAPLWRWLAKKLDDPLFAVIAILLASLLGLLFGQYLVDFIYVFYKGGVFPYSDRVFTTYILWWVMGLAAGRHYERIKASLTKHIAPITVLFAFSALHNVFLTYVHNTGKTWVYWLDTAHSFYVICAVMFMLALSVRLSETLFASSRPIRYIDRASYSIYLWHPLALYISDTVIAGKTLSVSALFGIRLAFAFVGTIAVCVAVAVITEKVSSLIGKKRRLKS